MNNRKLRQYIKRLKRKLEVSEKDREGWTNEWCKQFEQVKRLQTIISLNRETQESLLTTLKSRERLIGEKQNQIDKIVCQLAKLKSELSEERNCKNKAYLFILSNGLLERFKVFSREYKGENHIGIV
jgi:hypothetical protein